MADPVRRALIADDRGIRLRKWTNHVNNMNEIDVQDLDKIHFVILDDVARPGPRTTTGNSPTALHQRLCNEIHSVFSNEVDNCVVHSLRCSAGENERDFTRRVNELLEGGEETDLFIFWFHGKAGGQGKGWTIHLQGPGPNRVNAWKLIDGVIQARQSNCLFMMDCPYSTAGAKWGSRHSPLMTQILWAGAPTYDVHGNITRGDGNFTETLCRSIRKFAAKPKGQLRQTIPMLLHNDRGVDSLPVWAFVDKAKRPRNKEDRNPPARRVIFDTAETARLGLASIRLCAVAGRRHGEKGSGLGGPVADPDDDDSEDKSDGDSAFGGDDDNGPRPGGGGGGGRNPGRLGFGGPHGFRFGGANGGMGRGGGGTGGPGQRRGANGGGVSSDSDGDDSDGDGGSGSTRRPAARSRGRVNGAGPSIDSDEDGNGGSGSGSSRRLAARLGGGVSANEYGPTRPPGRLGRMPRLGGLLNGGQPLNEGGPLNVRGLFGNGTSGVSRLNGRSTGTNSDRIRRLLDGRRPSRSRSPSAGASGSSKKIKRSPSPDYDSKSGSAGFGGLGLGEGEVTSERSASPDDPGFCEIVRSTRKQPVFVDLTAPASHEEIDLTADEPEDLFVSQ